MKLYLNEVDPLFRIGEVVHATPKQVTAPVVVPKNDWRFTTTSDLQHPDAPAPVKSTKIRKTDLLPTSVIADDITGHVWYQADTVPNMEGWYQTDAQHFVGGADSMTPRYQYFWRSAETRGGYWGPVTYKCPGYCCPGKERAPDPKSAFRNRSIHQCVAWRMIP